MTHKAVRSEFDARLIEAGGSLSTFIVLRSAEEAAGEEGCSQRELAERMGIEGPTLVRHLDRLEREGLIERRRDRADRRITRISMTPAGEALLADLARTSAAADNDIRVVLGTETYDVVMGALIALQADMAVRLAERKTAERRIDAGATR